MSKLPHVCEHASSSAGGALNPLAAPSPYLSPECSLACRSTSREVEIWRFRKPARDWNLERQTPRVPIGPVNLVGLLSPTVREQWHKPKVSFVKSPSRRFPRADGVLSFQVLLVKKPKAQFPASRRLEAPSPIPIAPRRSSESST